MHPALTQHLELGGVPQIVVGLGILELGQLVENLALVTVMLGDGDAGPGVGAARIVVVRLIADEVNRELAPGDEFVEKAVAGRLEVGVLFGSGVHRESNGERTDVAEVEIGRELGGAVEFRVVAVAVVGIEHRWW